MNVSRVAGRLGEPSHAILTAGGAIGAMLTDLVRAEGLDPIPVEVSGSTRQNPTFSETRSDRQYRFVMPGPDMEEAECGAVLEAIAELDPVPEYLVLSGSLPPGVPDDSMVAGIVTGLARGWGIVEAVRYGLAAGAAAVMTEGSELARPEEVDRLYHRMDHDEAA